MSEDTTFEKALKNLEEAVARLEKGQMPLDEALDCFEAGVQSANLCRRKLQVVESRIEILTKGDGRCGQCRVDGVPGQVDRMASHIADLTAAKVPIHVPGQTAAEIAGIVRVHWRWTDPEVVVQVRGGVAGR